MFFYVFFKSITWGGKYVLLYYFLRFYVSFLVVFRFSVHLELIIFKKFIYFWLHWVFIVVLGLSLVAGAALSCGVGPSHCGGSSCCRAQAPECMLSSCAQSLLLQGMWDLPRLGVKWTLVPCIGRWIPSLRTTREVLGTDSYIQRDIGI